MRSMTFSFGLRVWLQKWFSKRFGQKIFFFYSSNTHIDSIVYFTVRALGLDRGRRMYEYGAATTY